MPHPKPRRGYCSTRTEAQSRWFHSDLQWPQAQLTAHTPGCRELVWEGTAPHQLTGSWSFSIDRTVKCLLITIRSQGAGLGLPWKGNPDLGWVLGKAQSLPCTSTEQHVVQSSFQHFLAWNYSSAPVSPFASCTTLVGGDGQCFPCLFGP